MTFHNQISSQEVKPAGLPFASPLHRFGSCLLESILAVLTLRIGWVLWWLVLVGQGQTPARKILGLRIVDAKKRFQQVVDKYSCGVLLFIS